MAIIKKYGTEGFTTLLNNHFKDKRLSWEAVGMLSNVFSLPDTWEFSIAGFQGMHKGGERKVRSCIFELEWFGYLERIKKVRLNGTVYDWDYIFYNISQLPDKKEPVPKWADRDIQKVNVVYVDDFGNPVEIVPHQLEMSSTSTFCRTG